MRRGASSPPPLTACPAARRRGPLGERTPADGDSLGPIGARRPRGLHQHPHQSGEHAQRHPMARLAADPRPSSCRPRLAFDLFEAPVCRSACRRGYIVEVSAVLAGTATPERCDAPTGQGSHDCARGLLSCDSPSQEHDATQCGDSCCSLRLERHEAVTLRGHKKFLWSRTVCPGTFPAMRIGA